MFQNKHIIRASFLSLFFAILACILFYRYYTIKYIVLENVIKDNSKIQTYFTDNTKSSIEGIEVIQKKKQLEEYISDKDFRNFIYRTSSYISKLNKLKVSVYSLFNEEIISSNNLSLEEYKLDFFEKLTDFFDKYFLSYVYKDDIVSVLKKGDRVNNIVQVSIKNGDKEIKNTIVESYSPIATIDGTELYGILKISTNITDDWEKINYLQSSVSIFLLCVFLTFFVIVVFNTQQAQKIIDEQVASNKNLEEARIKAESESSAKTQFLANVSHELRTPLNAIIGFSEVILTEAYGKLQPDQYKEYIQDINNSGKHLLSVINDILDFSKASANKLKIDLIEVDANKISSSSLRFVKPRADEAKVLLIEKLPKEHIVIKADPKRLKQALLNLLSNSVKFTPENGSVTLELENNVNDKMVYIRVIDTGIGMEEKDIPKALSSFGQIDNKLSRKYEGTGLGLPLTKKLVELMGGKFEISSKPGIGTTVTLSFKLEEF